MKMHKIKQLCVFQGRLGLAVLSGILFGLLTLASAVADASGDTKLVFLGNKNIAPVVYLDNGAPAGVAVDIVYALAKHIPQPIEIRAMDWPEAQALVARGDADALIQINQTEERRKIYDFSDTLLESQFSIFVSADRVGISGISSLQGLRVGVEAGGLPRQVLEKNPQILLSVIPNFLEGFKLLNAGAIDAVVVDYRVGSYVVAENKLRNIKISGDPIAFSYSSIAVKKGNTKLLAAINHALQIIKSDGTYHKILDKWKPTEVVFQTREQIRHKIYDVTTGILLILFLIAILWTLTLRNQLKRRKAAEEKAIVSLYTRSLIEASLDPLVTISVEGKITDVNEATMKATGVPRETLIGSDFSNYFSEPDKARAGYQEVFAKGFVTDYPLALRHASGSVMEVLYNASVYRNEKGEVAGVFAAARDVTQLRKAERLTRERVKELQAFFYLSELAARKDFSLDSFCHELVNVLPGSWQYPEITCARIVIRESEFRTANFAISEWMQAAPVKVFGAVIGKIEVGYLEQKPEEDEGPFLKEERQLINAIAERVEQITELKQAEEAIRINQARFSTIFNQAPLGIALIDSLTGRIYEVNPRFAEIAGRTIEEMMTIDWISITHPDDVQADLDNMILLNAGKIAGFNMDKRYIRPDGSFVWINMTIAPLRMEQNISPRHLCMIDDITDRKQAEEALKQASAYTRSLIEASLDPLVTISAEGKITDVNEATVRATGVSRKALLGSDFSNYFTEPDKARAGYQKAFAKGVVMDYPLALRHASGWVMEVLYNASVYRDEKGNVAGVFAVARDITDRKRAEEALNQASAYTRSLIEASLDPLVTISAEGKIMDVNQATERITGFPRKRLIGSDFSDYFTEPEKARQGYRRVLEEGFVKDYPLALRNLFGRVTEVLYNATVFRNEAGEVQGVFAAARDITERKRAEEALRDSEERFRETLESAPIGMALLSPEGRLLLVNRALSAITGYGREELLKMRFEEITHPDDVEADLAQMRRLEAGEIRSYQLEKRYLRKDGQAVWVLLTGSMLRGAPGRLPQIIKQVQDITPRKQAEQALQESEERYRSVIAALFEGVILMDADGSIRASNTSAERILGLTVDQMAGRTPLDPQWQAVHEDGSPFPGEMHPAWVTLQTGEPCHNVIQGVHKPDGALTWMSINSQALYRPGDTKPYAVVASFADITERKRAEEELRVLQAQLREEAIHDPLTRLYNRRYLEETLRRELVRAEREGYPLSILMGDIDFFKRLNDTYGHQAGDEVLRALGHLLRRHARSSDIPCRYGGEEFVVVLPDMPPELARARAELMRQDFANLRMAFGGAELVATLSIGVSGYPGHGMTADELIGVADRALYEAKQSGRNRVCYTAPSDYEGK